MSAFRDMIERQIRKAGAEGKLSGLEGEGKPLPDRSSEAHVDAGLAAGLRIMAEAGVVPEEFSLQKRIDALRAEMAGLVDPEARKAAMARLSDLMLRQEIARESRRAFLR